MRVYVVTSVQFRVCEVFATRKAAEQFVQNRTLGKSRYFVNDYEITEHKLRYTWDGR